jgi:enoyl-CoA hydratase
LEDAKTDPAVKVLIITGEGRAFSTGADQKESKSINCGKIGFFDQND